MIAALQHLRDFAAPKLRPLLRFLTSQGITLAGNLIYGLLCVRLLPTSDYVQFGVLFGVQGSIIVLMDVGISNSIVPLVGERIHDNQLIADYIASLRQLAHRLYFAVGAGLILVFPYLVRNRGWSWQIIAAMIAILLVSTWSARVSSAYGVVLILKRDRPKWYKAQMISSLGTLTVLLLFWNLHWLNAFSAILINVSGIIFVATYYYRRSQKLLGVRGNALASRRRAILRLALPNIPSGVFYALQGQISLLLITYFGRTSSVASIAALGRLGQIFVLFNQMNPLLVEPFFARLPRNKLKPAYFSAVFLVALLSAAITLFAVWFPQVFLWVLGPRYQNLHQEVVLVVAAGAISYTGGVMWTIHSSRRFIYWWNNLSTIALILAVELIFIFSSDLSSVKTLLLMNAATASVSLFIAILSGVYGFTKGPREAELPPTQPPPAGTLDPEELTGVDRGALEG